MIIFLYGHDSFRSRRVLHEMKAKFTKEIDTEENSLDTIDGQETTSEKINESINTGSLFTRKRMLVIENIFLNKKTSIFAQLTKNLSNLENSEDIIVIFREKELLNKKLGPDAKKLFTFLSKQKYSQEFQDLSPAGLNNFIKKEAELYNKKVSQEALVELLKRCGSDLWLISQTLKKASLGTESEILDASEITKYQIERYNEDIFSLTDAISAKNKTLAIKILEEQYAAGVSEEYLIAMLIRQFKILLRLREARDSGQRPDSIASSLKLHPYVVKKGLNQINNFTLENLKIYFNKIMYIDKKNKTEQGDIKSELLLLIAEI
ncbi:MAG TPA: DNA polymerase III subunit delta [Patescibacteria group bacterium]|nr:DNA polymerase III subunit delta [Patescibacteria group bacterium]